MLAVRRHAEEVERLLVRIRDCVGADEARSRLVDLTHGDLSRKVLHQLTYERRLSRLHEPEDVAHRVMERLKKVLESGRVQTVEELVRAANRNVRWVLGDLARGLREWGTSGGDVPKREALGGDVPEWKDDTTTESEVRDLEDWEGLHHQAAFLPGRAGQVFRLRYYDRLPVPEIADQLELSVRTVRDDWKEALNELSLQLTGRPFQGGAPKHLGGEGGHGEKRS